MEFLTLFILYTWKIILNILPRTRAAKYFKSVKIRPKLKDCPFGPSMTLSIRLWHPKSAFRYISVIQLENQVGDLIFHLTLPLSLEAVWGTQSGWYLSVPVHTPQCSVQCLFSLMPSQVHCTPPCRHPFKTAIAHLLFFSHLFVYSTLTMVINGLSEFTYLCINKEKMKQGSMSPILLAKWWCSDYIYPKWITIPSNLTIWNEKMCPFHGLLSWLLILKRLFNPLLN